MLDSVSKMAEMEGGASSVARLKRVIHVTLQWERLTYSVTVGRGKKRTVKTILDGISGHLEPGRLLAVMGPTGELMLMLWADVMGSGLVGRRLLLAGCAGGLAPPHVLCTRRAGSTLTRHLIALLLQAAARRA